MSDAPGLLAAECANGHLACPGHPICWECGAERVGSVDLADETAEVVTWTTSHATPPGVREPNTLAIVEFAVSDERVRVLGGTTTDDVEMGQTVRPVFVEELRDPEAGIREPESQEWHGYRFEPVDEPLR
jgi:uncharacterized OB-fold protein